VRPVNSVFTLPALFCLPERKQLHGTAFDRYYCRELICSWDCLLLFNRLYSWSLQATTSSSTLLKRSECRLQWFHSPRLRNKRFVLIFFTSCRTHRIVFWMKMFRWHRAAILSLIHSFSAFTLFNSCRKQKRKTLQSLESHTCGFAAVYDELKYLIHTIFKLHFLLQI